MCNMMQFPFLLLAILFSPIKTQDYITNDLDDISKTFANATRQARILLPHYYYKYNENSLYGTTTKPEEEYDFIIVGSGSAGSVLANRLSENPTWKILLLEVGEEASLLTDIPVLAPWFQFTNYNWNYLMEKQPNVCLGLVEQRMAWPRGRALGGSTIINYMIHVRGNPRDYDRWEALGNPGWAYKDVLPYFIKSEDCNVKEQDEKYHGHAGLLSVGDVPHRSESAHAFVKAAQEAGHSYVDYNGKDQLGVSYVQATIRRGTRCSGEKAFLRPARMRRNLTILTKARATKILIDPQTKIAYGVQYVRNRQYYTAKASKEVILSAGALNSPQLLMLSGVGPEAHLQQLGIPVIENLPVGRKIYDHITFVGLVFEVNETIVNEQKILEDPRAFVELILKGTGPLTTLGGVEALTYFRTNNSKDADLNYPDMELIFVGGSLATDKGRYYRRSFRLSDEIYNAIWKPHETKPLWQVLPMLVHPKSFGYLELKSKNPYHWPKFHGNYFTDPDNDDIKTFIAAIREVQRISKMPAMQRYGTIQISNPVPGCVAHAFDSDAYWECALRHITPTLHHQVATCKMGPANDVEAVVDSKLRVYGVKNLRVVDTSVIPIPLTAHTNVPAIMVGEKAADLIKEDWKEYRKIDIRRHGIYG